MEKAKSKLGFFRVTAAALLSFLFLAMLIPNVGKIVVDRSTTPATYTITDRPQQIAMLVGLLLVPLSLIYLGAKGIGFRVLEHIGWMLLSVLVILATKQFDR